VSPSLYRNGGHFQLQPLLRNSGRSGNNSTVSIYWLFVSSPRKTGTTIILHLPVESGKNPAGSIYRFLACKHYSENTNEDDLIQNKIEQSCHPAMSKQDIIEMVK
jgi:hypothetical protein